MKIRCTASLFVLCILGWGGAGRASAQGVAVIPGGNRARARVRSFQEIRDANVTRQKWDLSCGSAALSTLLTYHLHDPTPETAIIVWILHRTDPVRVQSRGGFSLLDLKRFVQARGYEAEGYAGLTIRDLTDFRRPAIVPVRVKGYDHFVVFRGVIGDRVLVADPSFGNLTTQIGRFSKTWKGGIAFYVSRKGEELPRQPLRPQIAHYLVPNSSAVYRDVLGTPIALPTR